jgi:DNA-binding NarL/FixJ family response regulator
MAVNAEPADRAAARIGLQSPDRLRREALGAYLATLDRFKVIGPVARPMDAAALCGLERVDVMLLDADRDPGAAIDAAGILQDQFPDVRVALMYDRVSPGQVALAQSRGVAAMVPSSHGLAAVLRTVTGLADGISPAVLSRTGLSDRQREILLLMASGHNTSEIGRLLRISPGTVENHKRRVYAKLGAGSAVEAIARAAALGIVDGTPLADGARGAPAVDGWGRPPVEDGRPVMVVALGQPVEEVDRAVRTSIAHRLPVVREVRPDPAVRGHWRSWHRGPVVRVLVNPLPDQWRVGAALADTAVIVHSEPVDQRLIRHAVANGGAAMIPAEDIETQLVAVVNLAARGYLVMGPGARAPFVDDAYLPVTERRGFVPELTGREYDILQSIGRHRTVRQTARSLGIALKTVENTQGHLFRKLGVHNRAEALAAAYSLGLLQPDSEI